MINIKIDNPIKLKNNILVKKSAFVKFDYDVEILAIIKSMSTRVYNPDNHTWEMPIQNIIGLCNKFENEEIKIEGIYETFRNELDDVSIPES